MGKRRAKKRIFTKRKGFTLIELLIVIVITGVLSGILIIAAGGAMDKAEATKIASDLKNIQSAAYLYFADESKWPSVDITLINPYMSTKLTEDGKYSFLEDNSVMKARYYDADVSAGIMQKLMNMQENGTPISVDIDGKSAEIVIHD